MADTQVLERIADLVHAHAGHGAPVDAERLARGRGVLILDSPGRVAFSIDHCIWIPPGVRKVRRHGLIAHEHGHIELDRAGEENTEDAARYLAGALLLHRPIFEADLERTWDVLELQAVHHNASAEMIATRIPQVRDARITIWDSVRRGERESWRCSRVVIAPGLPRRLRRQTPTPIEERLAAAARAARRTVREDSRLYAVPVFSEGYERVIVVAQAEQISLHFPRSR